MTSACKEKLSAQKTSAKCFNGVQPLKVSIRMYVYIHTHIHTHIYAIIRTYVHAYNAHIGLHVHAHTYIHSYIRTHTCTHTYVYICIHTHTCAWLVFVCARPRVVVFVRLCCCMKNIRTIIIIIILGMCLSVKIFFRRSEIVAIGRLSQTRRTDSVRRSLHSMIRKRSSSKQVRLLSSCVGLPAAESTRDAIERRCADGRQAGTAAKSQLHPSGTEQNIHTHV